MGLFSRKKKTTSSPSPSPASSVSSRLPSPPQTIIEHVAVEAPLALSVVLDGWTQGRDVQCFTLDVAKDADVTGLRAALALRLGDVSMSLFKVAIPMPAAKQARAYTERYKLPVNLVTSFPAFNVDDPDQLICSLARTGRQMTADKADLRVQDWFPEPYSADTISLLVRRADGPSTSIPVSFAVHVAQSGATLRGRPTTPGGRNVRAANPVIDIAPTTTVAQLKAAILKADSRSAEESERLVLWRVEMSDEEMVVIEERGGLKNGQMPWPYPPTAPVPSSMTDSSLPISHYFPACRSNTRIVSISAYIPASATSLHTRSLPAEAETAPVFRYPMFFLEDAPSSPASCSTATGTIRSPPLAMATHRTLSPVLGEKPKKPIQRTRPSTAPAVVVSPNGTPLAGVPAFGSRRMAVARPITPSPLNTSITPAKGLGINTGSTSGAAAVLAQHRGSTASQLSTMESEDEGSLPSLDFSTLSFDGEHTGRKGSISALNTPVTERSEWLHLSPASAGISKPLPGSTLAVPAKPPLDRTMSTGRASRWGRLVSSKVQG